MTESSLPPRQGDDEPIDAEFEPASLDGERTVSDASGPGWLAFGMVGLIAVTALGIAAASAGFIPGFKPGTQAMTAVETDIADLKSAQDASATMRRSNATDIAALQSRATSLQADRTRTVSDIRALRRELETLQADIATLQRARIASLAEEGSDQGVTASEDPDINALSIRVTSLEDALVSQLSDYDTQLEALRLRLDTMETQAQADALNAASGSNARTEAALALSAIEAAARRGRPFLTAHEKLSAAMPSNQAVQRLAEIASKPVPTIADLRSQYPALVTRALNQEAQAEGGTSSWMRGLFGDGIQVRQSGEVTVNDHLDAAQTALASGDLSNAIESIRAIDVDLQAVFTDWLDNAEDRLMLEETLEALRLTMIAEERP